MDYANLIAFWGDISIVALEAILYQQGDTNNSQYTNVKLVASDIIKLIKTTGLTNDEFQESVSFFLKIRQQYAENEISNSIPMDLVPATLVALCVKSFTTDNMSEETFRELIEKSNEYFSKYSNIGNFF